MIRTKMFSASVAVSAFAVASLLAVEVAAQSKPSIRIATGRSGGTYFTMGAILANTLKKSGLVKSANSETSSGAFESARLLGKGTIQVGCMDARSVTEVRTGSKRFKNKVEVRTASPMSVIPMFFVTRANSGIKTIGDIKGKKLAIGARGSGMEGHARFILNKLGLYKSIRPVYAAFSPGARAVREGKADLQFQCCPKNPSLTELSELAEIRHVAIPQNRLDIVTNATPAYGQMQVKKGAFKGLQRDFNAIQLGVGWMVAANSDPQIAYVVAKTIIEKYKEMSKKKKNFASIEPVFAAARKQGVKALEMGAPMHPGAIRAFKEAGILK